MTPREWLRKLAASLPSDTASVTLTKADLLAIAEAGGFGSTEDREEVRGGDLTVEDVAELTKRAPSTVRGWLINGDLRGYKLNGRDWRVTRKALNAYLEAQREPGPTPTETGTEVDLGAWRNAR